MEEIQANATPQTATPDETTERVASKSALPQKELVAKATALCKQFPMLQHRKAMGILAGLEQTDMLTDENTRISALLSIAHDYVKNTFRSQYVPFVAVIIGRYGTWPLKIAREMLRDPAEAKGLWLGMFAAAAHKMGYDWCSLAKNIYHEIQPLFPKEAEREALTKAFIEETDKFAEFRRSYQKVREDLGLIPPRRGAQNTEAQAGSESMGSDEGEGAPPSASTPSCEATV